MGKKVLYEAPDISSHQGNVNIKAVRDSGYPRIFLRSGYGKNNIDQKFTANATACLSLGISALNYWFSYALNVEMAENEAVYAISQAKKYWKKCPIAFDLEYDTVRYAATKGVRIDKKLATDMSIAFLKKVAEAGYTPVLYYNRDYGKNYFDIARIEKEVGKTYSWYALYSNSISDSELSKTDIWQYTSKGKINGVSGNVDINKVYTELFDVVPAEKNPVKNLYIQKFQKCANLDGYKDDSENLLVEDGLDGKRTQQVRKKVFLKAKAMYFVGSTGHLVKWWQSRLNENLGIDLIVDGKFGKTTREATIEFQKKYNLKQDGIAGYNTIQMAFYN